MTRHRSRDDRLHEILDAAARVVDEQGLDALTMDEVARRTSLSKGGVYRYVANRDVLALALFEASLTAEIDFDPDEVLGWGTPVLETLLRLMMHDHRDDDDQRLHRVFLQLLPQTLLKPAFREAKQRLEDGYIAQYGPLVLALLARDGLRPRPGFEQRLAVSLRLAATLMEGMTYRLIGGTTHEDLEAMCRRFLEAMLTDALEGHDD